MRISAGILLVVLFAASAALADPVPVKPDNCDFQLTFPAVPAASQTRTTTDRGDTVSTDKADLKLDIAGKTNFFRMECTKVPHMGFIDEAILTDNMNRLADDYKLQAPTVSIDRNKTTGPVGHLHGRAKLGGKDITLDIYRYTGSSNILDVWTGAEPDVFPTDANTAFLKSLKLNGADLQ